MIISIFFVIQILLVLILPNKLYILNIILLYIPVAIRGNIGFDTCAYRTIFYNIDDQYLNVEFGYYYFNLLVAQFTENAQIIIIIISLIQGYLVYYICRNIKNQKIFLLMYILSLYYSFSYNILRFGLATLFLGSAYVMSKSKIYKNINILLAIAFHSIGVMGILIYFRARSFLIFLIITGLVFLYFDPSQSAYYWKIRNLLINIDLDRDISYIVYLNILLSFLLVFMVKAPTNSVFLLLLCLPMPLIIDLYIPIVGRVYLVGILFIIILISNNWIIYSFSRKITILTLFIYIFLVNTGYIIFYGDDRVRVDSRGTASNYSIFDEKDNIRCFK
jgi:hypothetical protein